MRILRALPVLVCAATLLTVPAAQAGTEGARCERMRREHSETLQLVAAHDCRDRYLLYRVSVSFRRDRVEGERGHFELYNSREFIADSPAMEARRRNGHTFQNPPRDWPGNLLCVSYWRHTGPGMERRDQICLRS